LSIVDERLRLASEHGVLIGMAAELNVLYGRPSDWPVADKQAMASLAYELGVARAAFREAEEERLADFAYVPACSCCAASYAAIDREGGCRCDIGTCRRCDPDD
jgi:hypothetical protein